MQPNNPQKPVAYDTQGRPLYLHPQAQQPTPPAQQPAQPNSNPSQASPPISEEAQARHEQSRKQYPFLNLSEGEYVLKRVKRHPIGLLSIWLVTAGLLALVCVVAPVVLATQGLLSDIGVFGLGVIIGLTLLFLVGGYISAYVYKNNQFYLTNESIIQLIRQSLFAQRTQTISLGSVEDASFVKRGVIQYIFNYGRIRLSTVGEENTYRFDFVSDPKKQASMLNNAVEDYKNGRVVDINTEV